METQVSDLRSPKGENDNPAARGGEGGYLCLHAGHVVASRQSGKVSEQDQVQVLSSVRQILQPYSLIPKNTCFPVCIKLCQLFIQAEPQKIFI